MHRADIEAAVDDKLPYLLRFFGDDDDDVSVMVADFLIEHIAWMKSKNSSLTECQLAYCQVGTPVTSVGVVVTRGAGGWSSEVLAQCHGDYWERHYWHRADDCAVPACGVVGTWPDMDGLFLLFHTQPKCGGVGFAGQVLSTWKCCVGTASALSREASVGFFQLLILDGWWLTIPCCDSSSHCGFGRWNSVLRVCATARCHWLPFTGIQTTNRSLVAVSSLVGLCMSWSVWVWDTRFGQSLPDGFAVTVQSSPPSSCCRVHPMESFTKVITLWVEGAALEDSWGISLVDDDIVPWVVGDDLIGADC